MLHGMMIVNCFLTITTLSQTPSQIIANTIVIPVITIIVVITITRHHYRRHRYHHRRHLHHHRRHLHFKIYDGKPRRRRRSNKIILHTKQRE